MRTRTKERLMTAGTVLLICSVGVSLPGCGTVSQSMTLHTSEGTPITITSMDNVCTTDFDCEMHERKHTTHVEWSWKRVIGIAAAVAVTGYLLSKDSGNGHGSSSITSVVPPPNVPTPGVDCVATGCAR